MKTSISINYTEQGTGKKGQKTITDVNPDATSAQIKTFATLLNGLTTNIYGETNRIQVTNIDTEESGGSNTPQTFYLPIINNVDALQGSIAVTKYTYEQRNLLNAEDKAAFEEVYDALQEDDTITVIDLFWLAGDLGTDIRAYLGFAGTENVQFHVNGHPMEIVENIGYMAKLTELGAVDILVPIE